MHKAPYSFKPIGWGSGVGLRARILSRTIAPGLKFARIASARARWRSIISRKNWAPRSAWLDRWLFRIEKRATGRSSKGSLSVGINVSSRAPREGRRG